MTDSGVALTRNLTLSRRDNSDKLQDYADKFYAQQDDPNAWPFDPQDLTMEEFIDAG